MKQARALCTLIVDARARIRKAAEDGARIVAVADEDAVAGLAPRGVRTFVVPPLDEGSAALGPRTGLRESIFPTAFTSGT